MLTAVKVAFCFCSIFCVFEETVSWTIDLPQVRKYFFEKSLDDRAKDDVKAKDKVTYDNIDTYSLHTDYDKYRHYPEEHYADGKHYADREQNTDGKQYADEEQYYADKFKFNGYMERKVQEAVHNGSIYLEGLRRAVESYTRRLEGCRRLNVTANIIQFRPNLTAALSDPSVNLSEFNLSAANNFNLPTNFFSKLPANTTYIQLSVNFTRFMEMSRNYTMFNISDEFRDCMRADLASEHVRRLAQLAVWAASELQDKLYADKYDKDEHNHDDALVLRLAWFLDKLAQLTGYNPQPETVERSTVPPETGGSPPTLVPTLISNEDLLLLTTCLSRDSSAPAPERCTLPARGTPSQSASQTSAPDLNLSAAENQEYIYSEQVFTDDDMPLSLPQRPAKTKRKRSVQVDPLQDLVQYYVKYKVWAGSNNQEKDSSETSNSNQNENTLNFARHKRFISKKKFKHIKPDLGSIVKHKLEVHVKKDEKDKPLKKIIKKLHEKQKTEFKVFKFKKSKRSVEYSNKVQPKVPVDPQGDISYYVKNKPGRSYVYNPAQAALVRAGLEQVFQTGNLAVVQRYGSNYNPANTMQIQNAYIQSYADV